MLDQFAETAESGGEGREVPAHHLREGLRRTEEWETQRVAIES